MKHSLVRKSFLALLALPALLAAACSGTAAPAGKTASVVRIWPDYRTAESFDRISEFFTGGENTGGQIVLRSRPENRAGFYFFTRLKTTADISGARVELSVITPVSAQPKTYTFDAPLLRKGAVLLNPGLTGGDWPDADARPTAWRLRLLAANGAELFSEQSYLWSK